LALDFTCNSPAIKRRQLLPDSSTQGSLQEQVLQKITKKRLQRIGKKQKIAHQKTERKLPTAPLKKKKKKVTCCQFTRNISFYMYRPSDPTKGHQSFHTRTRLSFKLVVCAVRHSQLTVPLTVIKIGFFFSIPRPKWEDRVKMLIGKQNIPPSVDSTDKSALSGGINCTERFSKIHMLYASLDNIFLYQLEENSM